MHTKVRFICRSLNYKTSCTHTRYICGKYKPTNHEDDLAQLEHGLVVQVADHVVLRDEVVGAAPAHQALQHVVHQAQHRLADALFLGEVVQLDAVARPQQQAAQDVRLHYLLLRDVFNSWGKYNLKIHSKRLYQYILSFG